MKQSPIGPSSTTLLSTLVPMPTGQYTAETLTVICKVCLLRSLTGTYLLTGVVTVKTLHSDWTVKSDCVAERTMCWQVQY
jgi:hypothetical protein